MSVDDRDDSSTMKALVFQGRDRVVLEDRPRPSIIDTTDALVRITTTSICGTDLHILHGDVPGIGAGRILGHEGVGVVEAVGPDVTAFQQGDRVVISLISSCGRCRSCRKAMPSHCLTGGWRLGNSIDGTQAEYVRVPYADTGLFLLPPEIGAAAAVMLSCAFPTGMECGTLNGRVQPGDRVAIVGDGPVGLATMLTAQFFSPAQIVMIGRDEHRLTTALALGAAAVIDSSDGNAAERVMELTDGEGVDVAIEAVGIPETFELCQEIVAPGGRIANVGVHSKPVELHLERLWASNITLTTRLVDAGTTPLLLRMIQSGRLAPECLVSHTFTLSDTVQAYNTFAHAAKERALKVIITNEQFASNRERPGELAP